MRRRILVVDDEPGVLRAVCRILQESYEVEGVPSAEQALALATLANELSGQERPRLLATLAAAQAAGGDFEHATVTMERAVALAEDRGAARYVPELRERLALYRRGSTSVDGPAP